MTVLFWGLMIFGLSFLLHFIIWKIHIPQKQTKALLEVFFSSLIVCTAILLISSFNYSRVRSISPAGFREYFHLYIFFISLMLAYIVNYSALEVDSPTLTMVISIANKGKNGLDKQELLVLMSDGLLVKPRIDDLVSSNMIYLEEGKYKLTRNGSLFAHIFIFYRKLLNLPKGG